MRLLQGQTPPWLQQIKSAQKRVGFFKKTERYSQDINSLRFAIKLFKHPKHSHGLKRSKWRNQGEVSFESKEASGYFVESPDGRKAWTRRQERKSETVGFGHEIILQESVSCVKAKEGHQPDRGAVGRREIYGGVRFKWEDEIGTWRVEASDKKYLKIRKTKIMIKIFREDFGEINDFRLTWGIAQIKK